MTESTDISPDCRQAILAGDVKPDMPFSHRVWAVCRRIPRGRVATYGDLATALGQPGAARAVGGALHRNPLAPEVPCHRVVGTDGSLTGFAGGLEAKRRRLEREGVAVDPKGRINLDDYRTSLPAIP
ncbi:MAG: MGMT family protein [Phycisphaeraceae bacterium]|nr:MGMT family protein [Phycisphaeraceae bacterium]